MSDPLPYLLGSYVLAGLVFLLEPLLARARLARARAALRELDDALDEGGA